MSDSADDYEAGLELCLNEHRRLARLNPAHELLRYGDVREGDTFFMYSEAHLDEAAKRFGTGVRPQGVRACAAMLARHYIALREAADAAATKMAS